MSGKGSNRRKEDTKRVQDNYDGIQWNKRDKSKDDFKINEKKDE